MEVEKVNEVQDTTGTKSTLELDGKGKHRGSILEGNSQVEIVATCSHLQPPAAPRTIRPISLTFGITAKPSASALISADKKGSYVIGWCLCMNDYIPQLSP